MPERDDMPKKDDDFDLLEIVRQRISSGGSSDNVATEREDMPKKVTVTTLAETEQKNDSDPSEDADYDLMEIVRQRASGSSDNVATERDDMPEKVTVTLAGTEQKIDSDLSEEDGFDLMEIVRQRASGSSDNVATARDIMPKKVTMTTLAGSEQKNDSDPPEDDDFDLMEIVRQRASGSSDNVAIAKKKKITDKQGMKRAPTDAKPTENDESKELVDPLETFPSSSLAGELQIANGSNVPATLPPDPLVDKNLVVGVSVQTAGEHPATEVSLPRSTDATTLPGDPTRHQPGAFSAAPGTIHRRDPFRFDRLTAHERTPIRLTPRNNSDDRDLLVAEAVDEDDGLPQAKEIDLEAQEVNRQKRQKAVKQYSCVGGLVSLAVLVFFLVFFLADRPSPAKELNTIIASNTTSTLPPKKIAMEDYMASLLPKHTLLVLDKEDSPQSQAYKWILKDPKFEEYSELRTVQRFVLATLYYALQGDAWTNNTKWLSYEAHECQWFSHLIDLKDPTTFYDKASLEDLQMQAAEKNFDPCEATLDGENTFVHLWLWNNNLRGEIPMELYMLDSLKTIHLYSDNLDGSTIPTHIGLLTSLEEMIFILAGLVGTIPTEVGLLTNMEFFGIAANHMEGTIPSEFGLLSNLTALVLDENMFTGTIPSELALATALTHLYLYNNQLTGTIPSELYGGLQNLNQLYLYVNDLSGTIPSHVGQLQSMQVLRLDTNRFSGTIPSELGLLSNMIGLFLEKNHLTGRVPQELRFLAQNELMLGLDISGNFLSGSIPEELCDVGKLEENATCLFPDPEECDTKFDCSENLCGCRCPCPGLIP